MPTPEVLSIGNMLVEVMRVERDQPLDGPGTFAGPFPSGDTPIFIDTVARLGHRAGFIGAVGADDFGRCIHDRLQRDGVDTAHVVVLPDYATGVAFVAYFGDGSRRFLFHWRHAAAGQLAPEHVPTSYVAEARWLHLTGVNLAVAEGPRAACMHALGALSPEAWVSFDPNIRPEILSAGQIRRLCAPVVERANLLLPSLGEAAMLMGTPTDEAGCRALARAGKLVVLKQGAAGCRIFTADSEIAVPSFTVQEVDPTGAGDAFGAAWVVALLEGMPLAQAGRFANAVGALAVGKRGPMEGVPTRHEVDAFLARYDKDGVREK
jgi:tagatose kinase